MEWGMGNTGWGMRNGDMEWGMGMGTGNSGWGIGIGNVLVMSVIPIQAHHQHQYGKQYTVQLQLKVTCNTKFIKRCATCAVLRSMSLGITS